MKYPILLIIILAQFIHSGYNFICHYNHDVYSDGLFLYGKVDFFKRDKDDLSYTSLINDITLFYTSSYSPTIEDAIYDLYISKFSKSNTKISKVKFQNSIILKGFDYVTSHVLPVGNVIVINELDLLRFLINSDQIVEDSRFNDSSIMFEYPLVIEEWKVKKLKTMFPMVHKYGEHTSLAESEERAEIFPLVILLHGKINKFISEFKHNFFGKSMSKTYVIEMANFILVSNKREMMKIIDDSLNEFINNKDDGTFINTKDWFEYKQKVRTNLNALEKIRYYKQLIKVKEQKEQEEEIEENKTNNNKKKKEKKSLFHRIKSFRKRKGENDKQKEEIIGLKEEGCCQSKDIDKDLNSKEEDEEEEGNDEEEEDTRHLKIFFNKEGKVEELENISEFRTYRTKDYSTQNCYVFNDNQLINGIEEEVKIVELFTD